MQLYSTLRLIKGASLAAAIAFTASASAGVVTISNTTPVLDASDVGELSWTSTASDKTWTDTTNPGQTFTTDGFGALIYSFSMQVNTNSQTDPAPADKIWDLRLIQITGAGTSSTVSLETGHVSSGPWSAGQWFTWTFDTPVLLAPNTEYGVDVQMTSGGAYQPGIPYFRRNNSSSVDGSYRYSRVDGDPGTFSPDGGRDRVFHIDLQAVPEPGSLALLGLGGLMVGLRRRRA